MLFRSGTPEEVYHRPATTFVASFIGSPPMNLLKNASGAKPGHILGIRPEHLDVDSGVGAGGWQATIESIEMLGAERLLYCRLGDEQLVVRTDEAAAAPALGQTIGLAPRSDRVHHFDAAMGIRVNT